MNLDVALVSEHASPLAALGGVDAGGQNVHVAELAAALARMGNSVAVYTRRDSPDLPDVVTTPAGYRVVHVAAGPPAPVPKDELLQYMSAFGATLRDQWALAPPDIAHAHFWMSGLATQLAARQLGIPTAITFHALGSVKRRFQGSADTSPPQRIRFEQKIAHAASRVIATCSDEVLELGRLGVPANRVCVVPCGVDLNAFSPRRRATKRRGVGRRIVSVGRLVPRKGFETVIEALPHLPGTELTIVGGPPRKVFDTDSEVRRLTTRARDLGIENRLHMIGQVPRREMPALFRSAEVVVCAPWYEPFGIVPVEAMACGTPVVASAVGGMLDTVVDRVTGRLVPARNPRLLGDVVGALLDDLSLCRQYGEAGARRAVERYSWDRVAEDTARVYRSVAVPRVHSVASA